MHRVGQRVGKSLLWQLGMVVLWAGQSAAAASQPKVVVVVDPAAESFVVRQAQNTEVALQAKMAVVPLVDYLRAAKALGARPKATYGSEVAVAAGKAVGATHVLLFEPINLRVGSRRHETVHLATTLVDTATGESVLERRGARESARASQETVARVAAEVLAAVNAAPATLTSVAPPIDPPLAAPLVAPEPERRASPAAKAPVAAAPQPPLQTPVAAEKAKADPLPMPALAPLPPKTEPAVVAEAEAAPVAKKVRRSGEGPYGLHAQVGVLLYERIGLIRALDASTGKIEPKDRYGGGAGKKNPLFSRINLRFELQPTRFGRTHPLRWWDGLMVFADADMGWARTQLLNQKVVAARNGSWQLGGGWRQPLWMSPLAPVVALKLGYSRYSFKLPDGAQFISDGFAGFLTELAVEVPLGIKEVAVVGQAGLISGLKDFGGAQQLGDKMTNGLGGRVEAGLRFLIADHVDIDMAFYWQRYRVNYTGSSDAAAPLPEIYKTVGFSDQALGATARAGVRF